MFAASDILQSLLIAYIWVHTGSVFLAVLFHTTGNVIFFLVEPIPTTLDRTVSTLICVVVIAGFWRPARSDRSQTGLEVLPSSSTAGDAGA
jgi:hypothetical protein